MEEPFTVEAALLAAAEPLRSTVEAQAAAFIATVETGFGVVQTSLRAGTTVGLIAIATTGFVVLVSLARSAWPALTEVIAPITPMITEAPIITITTREIASSIAPFSIATVTISVDAG